MRLLLLIWAMLASLGVALSGAGAAVRQAETSISVTEEAIAPVAVQASRPVSRLPQRVATTFGLVVPWAVRSPIPLYADRLRE